MAGYQQLKNVFVLLSATIILNSKQGTLLQLVHNSCISYITVLCGPSLADGNRTYLVKESGNVCLYASFQMDFYIYHNYNGSKQPSVSVEMVCLFLSVQPLVDNAVYLPPVMLCTLHEIICKFLLNTTCIEWNYIYKHTYQASIIELALLVHSCTYLLKKLFTCSIDDTHSYQHIYLAFSIEYCNNWYDQCSKYVAFI